jgi:hypothetical protein
MIPPEQPIRLIRNQDVTLRFRMNPPRSISGWTVSFTVKTKLGGSTSISKTTSSGITLTNTGKGVLEVAIAAGNTSALTVSRSLASGEGYVWDLVRTDSGSRLVLARCELILEQEVT